MSEPLTTEHLKKKFKNNFALCAFAIRVGQNSVRNQSAVSLLEVLKEVKQRANDLPE